MHIILIRTWLLLVFCGLLGPVLGPGTAWGASHSQVQAMTEDHPVLSKKLKKRQARWEKRMLRWQARRVHKEARHKPREEASGLAKLTLALSLVAVLFILLGMITFVSLLVIMGFLLGAISFGIGIFALLSDPNMLGRFRTMIWVALILDVLISFFGWMIVIFFIFWW